MLAAKAGDAHGFRVVLSLSLLFIYLVGLTSWSRGSFFLRDNIRHVMERTTVRQYT